MYQDFNNLSDFYKTNIGRSLKNLISEKIKKYIFLYDHEHVGFFGFSEPYSDLLKNKKIKVFNFFYCRQLLIDFINDVCNLISIEFFFLIRIN